MSISWPQRKARLSELLNSEGDEDAEALALDRILHGQSVIGKTAKTTQIDALRFGDKDLHVLGTLEYGQFGVIDVVTCNLDGRVYVRKSTEKRFAQRAHDQCFPQLERDILLQASRSQSQWAPHLLCAFQTPTHLNLVMHYAEGGTLWDVIESSPHDGRITEHDLKWWAPQMVSAVHWCHSQGYVHRDIKPHNFVLKADSHILLIDFGSAAPLLPLRSDGSQQVPKRHCLVPCGTCDYISPEILEAHEAALVALEMSVDVEQQDIDGSGGYGRETDWWSLGAMLYEMAYGVAPFFAKDIRQTYLKIVDHGSSLRFDPKLFISSELRDLLRRLLTAAELRLGRGGLQEIQTHPFFRNIDWDHLHERTKPNDLHLPQFSYAVPMAPPPAAAPVSEPAEESYSRRFAFSALFQSSPASTQGFSVLSTTPKAGGSILREQGLATFIGFSWGPTADAFSANEAQDRSGQLQHASTPRPLKQHLSTASPFTLSVPSNSHATPSFLLHPFATPIKTSALPQHQTLPRTSTIRRTAARRAVSDREAMKQLVDCIGMSARKKVLESGRKPRILTSFSRGSRSSLVKELRFDRSVMVVNESGVSYKVDPTSSESTSVSALGASTGGFSASLSMSTGGVSDKTSVHLEMEMDTETDSSLETEAPPSPSPSPRPGSAMSILSRRSQTPTLLRVGLGSTRSWDSNRLLSPTLPEHYSQASPTETAFVLNNALSDKDLDDLEKRHAKLMQEIAGIDCRLRNLSVQTGSPS